MLEHLLEEDARATTLICLRKTGLEPWLDGQPDSRQAWVAANAFGAEAGQTLALPGPDGGVAAILAGLGDDDDPWTFAILAGKLPPGAYVIADAALAPRQAAWAALSWALATHAFNRYKSRPGRDWPRLVWPGNADRAWVTRTARAIALVRDLINTPAADLGPAELATAAEMLAAEHGATVRVTVGDGLIAENYPAVHAVGRAAAAHRQPRLVDMQWGDEAHPRVTLVGKGVCFDSGGLDIKASANMKLMKKDMGGAAHVLGLALMIMHARLPVRLRVLVPAVENAVSGDAMRPLDVLPTRKGLTVEVGNTDAEGRLILCDALTEASRDRPWLNWISSRGCSARPRRSAQGPPPRPGHWPGSSPDQTPWPPTWPASPKPRPIPCGGCRCTVPTAGCSTARWPTCPTFPTVPMPGRSPPPCSCRNSSPPTSPGCISTSWPGTPPAVPAAPMAARPWPSAPCSR